MTNTKILLVEDDTYLGFIVKDLFESKQFDVSHFTNAEDASASYDQAKYDICILDVNLPGKDGFSLAREIREKDKNTPIIFLTAKSLKEDVIEGFKIGADDYIKKPFSMDELIMRVEAVLRRSHPVSEATEKEKLFQCEFFSYDYTAQKLIIGTNENKLSHKENELLKHLCDNRNNIVDRKEVLIALWGDDSFFNARSMDVYIAKLRKYFKETPEVEILNIRGKGYKLLVDE